MLSNLYAVLIFRRICDADSMRIWRLDPEEKHVLPIYAWTTYLCAAASKVMGFGAFVG